MWKVHMGCAVDRSPKPISHHPKDGRTFHPNNPTLATGSLGLEAADKQTLEELTVLPGFLKGVFPPHHLDLASGRDYTLQRGGLGKPSCPHPPACGCCLEASTAFYGLSFSGRLFQDAVCEHWSSHPLLEFLFPRCLP